MGCDVPGFYLDPVKIVDGKEVMDELLVLRWYQLGIVMPFFRAHAMILCKPREPWNLGETLLDKIRSLIRTRYRLLPYLYQVFQDAPLPVLRPLWLHHDQDDAVAGIEDQFLLGQNIMVKVLADKDSEEVIFPKDSQWKLYDSADQLPGGCSATTFEGGETKTFPTEGLSRMLIFFRVGSVIPLYTAADVEKALSTEDLVDAQLEIVPIFDSDNTAITSTLYLDDMKTLAYKKEQKYTKIETHFTIDDHANVNGTFTKVHDGLSKLGSSN